MRARLASDAVALAAVAINYAISSEPLAGLTLLLVALVLSLNIAFVGGAFLGLWALTAAAAVRQITAFFVGAPLAAMALYLVLLSVLHRYVELPEETAKKSVLVLSALGAGGAATLLTSPALVAWVAMGPVIDLSIEELLNSVYNLRGRASLISAMIARAAVALAVGAHPALVLTVSIASLARIALGKGHHFIIFDAVVRAAGAYAVGVGAV